MVILVVFNSFHVVKYLKKPDLVAGQKPPFYTTLTKVKNFHEIFRYLFQILAVPLLFLIKLQAFRLQTSIKTVKKMENDENLISIKTEKVSGKLTTHIPLTLMF